MTFVLGKGWGYEKIFEMDAVMRDTGFAWGTGCIWSPCGYHTKGY
jgi:hypothetical protein